MTITASFFDHVKYPAQEFINRDKDFIGNGVLKPATDFALTYPGGMNINFAAGTAWINGLRIGYDANPILSLVFAKADSTNPRIDLIEIGTTGIGTQGAGVIQIVKGIPALSPLQPQPDSGSIGLYAVSIAANATQVSSVNVTDLRTGVTLTGAATTPLADQAPGTQLFNTTGSAGTSLKAARQDHSHPMAALPNATQSSAGVVEVAENPASGTPVVPSRVATANEVKLTTTTAASINTYTPSQSGNFEVDVYLRVTANANITVSVSYSDSTGPQTQNMNYQPGGLYFQCISGIQPYTVGSYSLPPLFINAVAGAPITVKVMASVANQVYVSSSVVGV